MNEVAWMGALVAEAATLCSQGNREYYDREIMVSNIFYQNLNDHNKALLSKHAIHNCYHGNVVSVAMDKWLKEQV